MSFSSINKHTAVLNAALKLFAENGFHSAPISQVASLANVGVGTIYRYFKDKDELVHAVSDIVEQTIQEKLIDSLDPLQSVREQFVQLIIRFVDYMRLHPLEFKFLEQYYSSPYGVEKKRSKFMSEEGGDLANPIIDLFFENQGRLIKDIPLPLFLSMTFGPLIFLLGDSFSGLVVLDEKLIEQAAEACWDAVKA